ncbi:helix-turn-helix domain-containing protein [Streptomyces sp. NPDC047097]|uniref:helix-turn-helix domain-containing protein n=1 Tax=Streptomyces sp. NPDC047097 TaxID=3155260 RepID=UPI0033EB9A11
MTTHGLAVRQKALTLLRDGTKNTVVARSLGVPVGTISYWKHVDRVKRGEPPRRTDAVCSRCQDGVLDRSAYAYLLGLYLGDGHISHYAGHRVPSLMISCTESWGGLLDACEQTIRKVFPDNAVCRVSRTGCVNVKVYSKHLSCLFPQHGPGKKHERRVALEEWQQEIVRDHTWEFISGLIHSDGCRITNWTTKIIGGERKRYEYPRYFFSNMSDDIRKMFTDALDLVGVEWSALKRRGAEFNISVARRASVALMDAHVGPKH